MMKKIFLLFFGTLLLSSCNKEKRYSNKLLKGERWVVESLVIDGQESQMKGEWRVLSDQDIYDVAPKADWYNDGEAIFEWQFQDEGEKFQLNYVQLCEECDGDDLDSIDYFVYDISGSYDVKRKKKKEMEFRSSSTIAYSGKEVVIKIKRK